jgi:hypothetical protein
MTKNSVTHRFGRRYVNIYSRVARSEQARLQRTLIREYEGCRRRPCQSCFSACSVFFAVEDLVFIRVHSWLISTKVAYTGCPITMLILQNEPNFRPIWLKIEDLPKKRTQFYPSRWCLSGNPILLVPMSEGSGGPDAESPDVFYRDLSGFIGAVYRDTAWAIWVTLLSPIYMVRCIAFFAVRRTHACPERSRRDSVRIFIIKHQE